MLTEGGRCRTPYLLPGFCINIKKCDSLLRLLRTQSNVSQVRDYLLRSTCGYAGTTPLVCCPQPTRDNTNGATGFSTPRAETTTRSTQSTVKIVPTPPPVEPLPTESRENENRDQFKTTLPRDPDCGFSNVSKSRIVGGVNAQLGKLFLGFGLGVVFS